MVLNTKFEIYYEKVSMQENPTKSKWILVWSTEFPSKTISTVRPKGAFAAKIDFYSKNWSLFFFQLVLMKFGSLDPNLLSNCGKDYTNPPNRSCFIKFKIIGPVSKKISSKITTNQSIWDHWAILHLN